MWIKRKLGVDIDPSSYSKVLDKKTKKRKEANKVEG